MPTETQAEARQLIDTVVSEIRLLGDQIPYTIALYDDPRNLEEPGDEQGWPQTER